MGLSFDPIAEAGRNWRRSGWGGTEAMLAATSVTRAHQILLARINEALAPFGITFSRFEVLALLHFAGDNELPMGKIGDRLQVHPTSVTSLVERLSVDELVERRASPDDRRLALIRLTPAGVKLVTTAAEALAEVDFGLRGLGRDARRRLVADLGSLRESNGDWAAEPTAGNH